ncbi:chitobiase/beta-hexosaminidase C-terminal domain-containing protein (plasmid) [Paenibacillus sp. EC2-1]|uniref:chitobiase/beta-hexosaminidase C-terminal domain-containing protein n=1 Tax=Paenibacillus sp. EC2-1 TaxID=3388665 RepID=UPI003BEF2EAF
MPAGDTYEIRIDTKNNPQGTEYIIQRSYNSNFSNPVVLSNWSTTTVVTDPITGTPTYYRVKARNSRGVETDWESVAASLPPVLMITPKQGIYSDDTKIALQLDQTGKIYYTTDGSSPTTSSTEYKTPINLSSDMTIKALGVNDRSEQSNVISEAYTVLRPSTLSYTVAGSTVTLGWTAVAGAAGYNVYDGENKKLTPSPITVVSWSETLPISVIQKSYYIRVVDSQGKESRASNTIGTLINHPLTTPENLRAEKIEGKSLTIAWDRDPAATGYELKRGGVVVYTGAGLSYKDTGLSEETSYSYTVRSTRGSTFSDPSASKTFKTIITGPVAKLDWASGTQANVSWYWDYRFSGGYKVYLDGTMVKHLPDSRSSSYTFSKLTPGREYTIYVSGIDSKGAESNGDSIKITTISFSAPTLMISDDTKDYVKLQYGWGNEYPDEFVITRDGIELHRDQPTYAGYRYFTDNSVVLDQTYTYKVKAISGGVASPEAVVTIKISDIASVTYKDWDLSTHDATARVSHDTVGLSGVPLSTSFQLKKGALGRLSGRMHTDLTMYVVLSVAPPGVNYVSAEDEARMIGNMYPLPTTSTDPFSNGSMSATVNKNLLSLGRLVTLIMPGAGISNWEGAGGNYKDTVMMDCYVAPYYYGNDGSPHKNVDVTKFAANIYVKLVANQASGIEKLGGKETPWLKCSSGINYKK